MLDNQIPPHEKTRVFDYKINYVKITFGGRFSAGTTFKTVGGRIKRFFKIKLSALSFKGLRVYFYRIHGGFRRHNTAVVFH